METDVSIMADESLNAEGIGSLLGRIECRYSQILYTR